MCLKCPKETKAAAPPVVDFFLCPIKAFLTWHRLKERDREKPLFQLDDGTPLTGTRMNRFLGNFLDPYTEKNIGVFKMHSFQIGLASMLGNLGFTDAQVQDMASCTTPHSRPSFSSAKSCGSTTLERMCPPSQLTGWAGDTRRKFEACCGLLLSVCIPYVGGIGRMGIRWIPLWT